MGMFFGFKTPVLPSCYSRRDVAMARDLLKSGKAVSFAATFTATQIVRMASEPEEVLGLSRLATTSSASRITSRPGTAGG